MTLYSEDHPTCGVIWAVALAVAAAAISPVMWWAVRAMIGAT